MKIRKILQKIIIFIEKKKKNYLTFSLFNTIRGSDGFHKKAYIYTFLAGLIAGFYIYSIIIINYETFKK